MDATNTKPATETPAMVVEDRHGNLCNLVAPVGYTRGDLTYGYVRAIGFERARGGMHATVFWPEVGTVGSGWRPVDIVKL